MNSILNKAKTTIFLLLNLNLWSPMVSSATKEFSVKSIIHFQKHPALHLSHFSWVSGYGNRNIRLQLQFVFPLSAGETYRVFDLFAMTGSLEG